MYFSRLALFPLFCIALSQIACAGSDGVRKKVATELWVGGDDGLTQKFAETLRTAIEESTDFGTSVSTDSDALLLTIPTHLYSRPAQGRTNFQYVVIFTDRQSKYLGVSVGSCWEDSMERCALSVLSDARIAWAARSEA